MVTPVAHLFQHCHYNNFVTATMDKETETGVDYGGNNSTVTLEKIVVFLWYCGIYLFYFIYFIKLSFFLFLLKD